MKMHMTRLEQILSERTMSCWGDLMCLDTPLTHGRSCVSCRKGVTFGTAVRTLLGMPSALSSKPYIIILIDSPSQDCVPSYSITPPLLEGGGDFYPFRGDTSAPPFFNNFSLQTSSRSDSLGVFVMPLGVLIQFQERFWSIEGVV